MSKLGAALVVVLVGCGSSSALDIPDDHQLHDLSTDDAEARHMRYGGKQVSLADLPMVAAKLGLPVTGTADISIDLSTPKAAQMDYTKTTGSISIGCTKCQIGDDVTRLHVAGKPANAFAAEGIAFGHLAVDSLEAKLTAANGKLELTSWKLASPDLALEVSLSITFDRVLMKSEVDGCIRFKATDALQKRDPKMYALLVLTGAASGADGFQHIKLRGQLSHVKRLSAECKTN